MSMYVICGIREIFLISLIIISPSLVACIAKKIVVESKPLYTNSLLNSEFFWAVKTVDQ
jgi:hypothetical protein